MGKVVIYGTGGFGREVHQLLLDSERETDFVGFIDDNPENHGKLVHDKPVLGGMEWIIQNADVGVLIGIGNTVVKRRIVKRIKEAIPSAKFPTLMHPTALIGINVEIGEGTIICAGNIITTDIAIGPHVILNLDCTVGHDAILHDYVTVAPSCNISGNVRVGEGCDLGTNSTIIQGKNIGEWSIVGAGAVVVKDIPPNATVVGNPTKVIKQREPGWHEPNKINA